MRIFITGATGFVGTEFVRRVSQTSHEARCLVRDTGRADALRAMGATLVNGDVTNPRSLHRGMRGSDWVVHLANLYEFWLPDARAFDAVNVEGTRHVMEAALAAGVGKVVHVSTVAVYGDAGGLVTETTPWGERVPGDYARTKRAAEEIARAFHTARGLPVVIISPGAILGPNDPKSTGRYLADLVAGRIPAAVFPSSPFPFVHVRDVAEAILRALEKDGDAGEKYLVVAETSSFGAINQMVADIAGVRPPRFAMSGPFAMAGARLATWLSDVTGRPPLLGMALEQFRMLAHGIAVDGSKAQRELGLTYLPIRTALEDALRLQGLGRRA